MQAPGHSDIDDDEPREPVVVPHSELSAQALQGVLESFVLREGTDYGEKEFSLGQKIAHVLRQLERGEAQVVFDPNTESIGIVVGVIIPRTTLET